MDLRELLRYFFYFLSVCFIGVGLYFLGQGVYLILSIFLFFISLIILIVLGILDHFHFFD